MTADDLKALIRTVPDFPKPGILFRDITTLIADGQGFAATIALLAEQAQAAGPALASQLPTLEAAALEALARRGWQPDYLTVRRRSDLQLPQAGDTSLVALGAARVGTTRLIDNLEFTSISP